MNGLALYLVGSINYVSQCRIGTVAIFLQRSECLVYNDKITMSTTTTMKSTVIIKTRNKFWDVTGSHQPDLNDRTVYLFNRARAFIVHIAELAVDFLFMKTCNQ